MSIFKKLGLDGSVALSTTGPIGMAVAAAANIFLSGEDTIRPEDSLDVVDAKLASLPEDQRARVMEAYYSYLEDKVINDNLVTVNKADNLTEQLRIMEQTDQKIQVRPEITNRMAWFVCIVSGIVALAHCYDVIWGEGEWNEYLIGTLLFLPTWVVQKYFDRRSDDKVLKANLLSQQPLNPPKRLGSKLVEKVLN